MKQRKKNNKIELELGKFFGSKGVTLLSLIVTIIVLLILAGITWYVFSEKGPIEHAKMSSFATQYREIEERVFLYSSEKEMEQVEKKMQGDTNISESILPIGNQVTNEEKEKIRQEKSELEVKIKELSGRSLEEANLYWIVQEKIDSNQKDSYMIDIESGKIYQYEGKKIYGLIWHTLEGGVKQGSNVIPGEEEELWDGWIRLTLYYPSGATNKEWRIGEEGETRYDKNLMWQSYTGAIWVRLKDVENVWIRYVLNGEEQVIAPSGRLAVDIQPDSYYPNMVNQVKIKIYYDKTAELREYKVGNGPWITYEGEFYVTENTIVEARAKKVEKISDTNGNIIGEKEIWGRDNIYVGNIGIQESELEAPNITRKPADSAVEKEVAKVEVTYPTDATRKIYKINYGEEREYTQDISITKYGTHVIAYYYNSEGKRSRAKQIVINQDNSNAEDYIPNPPGTPTPGGGSNPIEPSYTIPEPIIFSSPTSITQGAVTVEIYPPNGYSAEKIYYKLDEEKYQEYSHSFNVTTNTSVTAYYITNKGERSSTARKRINNIQEAGKPYVKIVASPDPYEVPYNAEKVQITITSKDAEKVEYSLNGITYQPYTGGFELTKNARVYAKATNSKGEALDYIDIDNLGNEPEKLERLNVAIRVNPEPKLTAELVEKAEVSIEYDERATSKYYKIGEQGKLQDYTGSFEVTGNCTIYAYAISEKGKGETRKQIDHLTKGISSPEILLTPSQAVQASTVTVSINYDRSANITRYKIDNGSYIDYTGPFTIQKNGTITAYNKNKLGYEASASKQISNIKETTTIIIDKGQYYLLKLNYPPNSTKREYKWQDDGEWKAYKEDGILLIKPEYKDEILKANGEIKIKIEDETGKKIDFKGDYYFVTKSIQELMEHVYLRWDRTIPQAPTIMLNTEEPTKEVSVNIQYPSSQIKKEYRVVEPNGQSSQWKDYTEPFTITKKNTVIYARGKDEAEVWSQEAIKKIINIDEEPPIIKVTADLEKSTQKVGIKVEVSDDVKVETVMWAKGIRQESYFNTEGTVIANNSIFYVTENGYYTIYAKDGVGNTSTYTIQVQNVDVTPPSIAIKITPDNTIVTEVKVDIDYGDSTQKQYKIGENNTSWSNYVGQISLTSNTVIAKGWKNVDNTITVYAKGKDSAGNEQIVTYKILSLDVDTPKTPVITSKYGYPILTEYGVEFDGETSISYDTRPDIDNYYSLDNGATWKRYTGSFQVNTTGTIIAKSVKKNSGLDVIASKSIGMPTDAIGPKAYDGNSSTAVSTMNLGYPLAIEVSSSMWNKSINVNARSVNGDNYIGFYDSNNKEIKKMAYPYSNINAKIVIPENTVKITFYSVTGRWWTIYEISVANEPVIEDKQHYSVITRYGVESGYTMVDIHYIETSAQRLYKIDSGEWKTYQNKEIRLEIGQTVYAKGIDKNGEETRIITSYTAKTKKDAIGSKAYDGNSSTAVSTMNLGYPLAIEVSSSMWNKSINVNARSVNGDNYIGFYDSNNKEIKKMAYPYSNINAKIVIPENTVKITFYSIAGRWWDIYEISVVK